jgi:hypothetical protein
MMRSRSLSPCLLALAVLSCRQVPATLPESEPEPSSRGSVFVESQPNRQGDGGPIEPLTSEAIALYSCWFEDPYEYMFSYVGEPLTIGNRDFGMLMAGTGGILYYGALNVCAGRMTASEPTSFTDLEPITRYAGLSPVLPINPGLPFDTVNPEFIAWARARLLPAAEHSIDGVSVQLTYDRVFSRLFRLLGESLFFLLETTAIETVASTYIRDITTRGVDGIDWLERRYGSIPAHGGSRDYSTLTAPMAAGFWLRRQLDGSLPACWHGLRDVYEHYDRAWLDDLRARYPKAATALAQVSDSTPAR